MCFSASASFATSGMLSLVGTAAIREVRVSPRALLAAIPLLFAIHQFAEGVVWLTLGAGDHPGWHRPAMFVYLAVAKIVWPLWIPLSLFIVERNTAYRRVLIPLLVMGVVSSLYQAYQLSAYTVSAGVAARHIHYEIASPPAARQLAAVLYFVPTVVPPFCTSLRLMRVVGLGIFGSFIFSAIYFPEALGSVWCFFAAFISVLIWFVVRTPREAPTRC